MRKNTERIAGWFFDQQGNLRLAVARRRQRRSRDSARRRRQASRKIYSCTVFESCSPMQFQQRRQARLHGDQQGRRRPDVTDAVRSRDAAKSKWWSPIPLNKVDFGEALFSEATDELLLTTYEDDRTRRYFKDKKLAADYHWLRKKLPGKRSTSARTPKTTASGW